MSRPSTIIQRGAYADRPATLDTVEEGVLYYADDTETLYQWTGTAWFQWAIGSLGIDGTDGADGADGAPGADGINGTNGTNGTDGADGADGADGVNGVDGADGAPGSKIRTGEGPPSDTLGLDGDFYLDTTTGDFYERTAGVYAIAASLLGPAGADGEAGPPGADGADGPEGPTGPAGATISVGSTTTLAPGDPATVVNSGTSSVAVFDFGIPQGIQGPAGPPGADGADGTGALPTGTENNTARFDASGDLVETGFVTNDETRVIINPGGDTDPDGDGLNRFRVLGRSPGGYPNEALVQIGDDATPGPVIPTPPSFPNGVVLVEIGSVNGDAAILLTDNGAYGLLIANRIDPAHTGDAHMAIGNGGVGSRPLLLQPLGGNVGIGDPGTTPLRMPTEKLEVYGNVLADGYKVYDGGTAVDGLTEDIVIGSVTLHVVGGLIVGYS